MLRRHGYRAARLFTGDHLLAPGTVVLRGRFIEWVGSGAPPESAPVEDLGLATILPGLIDAHSHLSIDPALGDQIGQLRRPFEAQLASARRHAPLDLASGVTTMRVVGEEGGLDFALDREIQGGLVAGPDLICAGVQIARCGHHGHAQTCVTDAADIEALARRNVADGARALKIFATGGIATSGTAVDAVPFTAREIGVAAAVAHEAGMMLAAHAHGGAGALHAIEGGVDTIEHAAAFDDACLEALVRHDAMAVGTFSIVFDPRGIEAGDAGNPVIMDKLRRVRETVERSWLAILDAGVRIAVGTDSMHGLLAHDVARLVAFGADPQRAIAAATVGGAEACGLTDRGRLVAGLRADLIAVPGNPFEDISRLAHPLLVIANGRRV